ncbi:MAG: AAA family ATPase, partial [Caldilineaceae bacterium]
MPYQILRRRDYEPTSAELAPAIRRKADWAIVQLGVRGRTPSTKGTIGHPLPWRRSPVQGSHYYLWWLNAGDSGMALNGHSRRAAAAEGAILVHSIRHHDETDTPLTVGVVSDYEPLDVGLLDPRFDDQEEIALVAQEGDVSFTVIEGMPGSGKSVALLFLARDLATRAGTRKVRYITYTERLKRSARELFDALGPEIAPHITVHTVNDVVKQLAGVEVVSSPYGEINAFVRELDLLSPAQAGLWKPYPLTLYTELRAQVAGRTFPAGYQLPAHREEQMRRHGGQIDVERYARRRKLDLRAAEQSVNLAERMANRFFLDQMMASRALDKLHKGETSSWLAHTDALIIDEVQDFTLLQIALVAEMAAARRKAHPERPLSLTIAGDESQIVQPTGFKWGVTKD